MEAKRFVDVSKVDKIDTSHLVGDKNGIITIVQNMYFYVPGFDPASVRAGYHYYVKNIEVDLYSRKVTINSVDGWVKLIDKYCWVTDVGTILIHNLIENSLINEDCRMLLVSFDSGESTAFVLKPGRAVVFEPANPDNIMVRAVNGSVPIGLYIAAK